MAQSYQIKMTKMPSFRFHHASSLTASTITVTLAILFILALTSSSIFCQAFVPQLQSARCTRDQYQYQHVKLYSSTGDDNEGDSSFMANLKERMEQVSKNDNIPPIVVLDSMLPRQVLNITIQNRLLIELVRTRWQEDTPSFGMVGRARVMTIDEGDTPSEMTLTSGVEVELMGPPRVTDDGRSLQLSLKGGRRFRLQRATVESAPQGWTQASVQFLNSTMDDNAESSSSSSSSVPMSLARAMQMAREFTEPNFSLAENQSLVDMWLSLARQRERSPGQIDGILQDLGPMPSWEEPTECAMWVGALINPIPALGVALEIRPKLLLARTAEERTQIALDAIWNSIQHMQGADRFQQIKE
jgi:Lon protease-like protein